MFTLALAPLSIAAALTTQQPYAWTLAVLAVALALTADVLRWVAARDTRPGVVRK